MRMCVNSLQKMTFLLLVSGTFLWGERGARGVSKILGRHWAKVLSVLIAFKALLL